MARSRRAALVALALAPIMAIAGCTSSGSTKEPGTWTGASEGNRNNQGAPPAASEPARRNDGKETPLCSDPIVGDGSRIDPFCNYTNDTPWYDRSFDKEMAYKPGRAPHSTKVGDRINVSSFVLNTMRSQRTVWREYFAGSGITVPSFGTDIVTGTETYESNCPNSYVQGALSDKPFTVKANSPTGLYCPMDDPHGGHVALPGSTLAKLWSTTDRKTADMAVTIVASRAGSQMLNQTLLTSKRYGVGSTNRFEASSCLAGVWARGVYQETDADDLDRALKLAEKVPVAIGTDEVPDMSAQTRAWQIGFTEGRVSTCSDSSTWLHRDQLP